MVELREEICKYTERKYGVSYDSKKQVLVTVGGSEAIDALIRCVIRSGDEVLIPEPSFVCYKPLTVMAGGVPVPIETKEENNFRLTPEELREKITDKTKLLIMPYPNNPYGRSNVACRFGGDCGRASRYEYTGAFGRNIFGTALWR